MFNDLIDKKVNVRATVTKVTHDYTSTDRLLLEDVYVNDSYFRDHVWVKATKRFSKLTVGDSFTSTAMLKTYISVDGQKIGLEEFRSITVSS